MTGKRVVLHIGTMKSGTTYLQSVLSTNLDLLDRAGVYAISGNGTPDRGRPHQAAKMLQSTPTGRRPWQQIVDAVDGAPGESVVVSSEFFSFLRPQGVETALTSLADHEVVVVVTVRDQIGAIPAQWQSFTRNRGRASFAAYVHQITDAERRRRMAYRSFHRAQGVARMVEGWKRPGVDRLLIVTVPPSGSPPDLMWRRFAEAAGIPPVDVNLDDVVDNQSLGYAACDYLRRVNRHLGDLSQGDYRRTMRPVARQVLAPLRAGQERARVDRATAELAVERNRALVGVVESAGVDHVGAIGDLPVEVDLTSFPEEIAAPDRAQVRESARVVLDYAADGASVTLPGRPGLHKLVSEGARLLRERAAR